MRLPQQSLAMRTLLAAGLVALLVHLAESRDAVLDFSRPVVIATLHLVGVAAHDEGETIGVGRLSVPWTRDCAGVNLLLILLALGVWINRSAPLDKRYWLRLAFMVPAALLANVARVLTLVTYRQVFFPMVENPQMHYFMGLVWLVPVLAFVCPRGHRPKRWVVTESLHAAATVALLAPMCGTPQGDWVTVAAVLALAHCKVHTDRLTLRNWLMLPWLAVGALIAMVSMESFWLPWLLICPMLIEIGWILNPAAWIVIASTNPMTFQLPGALPVSLAALGWIAWQWWQQHSSPDQSSHDSAAQHRRWGKACLGLVALSFAIPFIAATLLSYHFERWTPPAEVASRPLGDEGYQLQLPDQHEDIALCAYGPASANRHHTMKVCLKYRGIEIQDIAESQDVVTDGEHWLREFFMHEHKLLPTYSAYLRSTFKPGSSPGVHLIFVTPKGAMTPAAFNEACLHLAAELQRQCTLPSSSTLIARQP